MRKICVVTGSRAEYGLLYWLMREIQEDPDLRLQVAVTGAHLSPEFGLSFRQIEADGFTIDEKVETLMASDTPAAIAKAIGLGVIGFADALTRLAPDLIVVLGDRFEILAVVEAALVARIPVAHLHGGEITEGAFDDAIRHAITKMGHLHFTAAEEYRARVIRMGEAPGRVFNVGALAADNIKNLPPMSREELKKELGFDFGERFLLVTYHPVTLSGDGPREAIIAMLAALDAFPETNVVITAPNADPDGKKIRTMFLDYAAAQPGRVRFYETLGRIRYLQAMRQAAAVVGNSSSGLIEAPAMKTATVNIGPRQKGRLMAASVICCDESEEGIRKGIEQALSKKFQAGLAAVVSPFGAGGAARWIKEIVKQADLTGILMKGFYQP